MQQYAWIVQVKKLVISNKVGDWCQLPYHNHPKGCPNYNRKPKCPPNAPHVSDYFNTSLPMYLIHSEFNLEEHAAKMKAAHPNWSYHQCRCVLYWQPRSRKQMVERATLAMKYYKCNRATACPEGMGVNVYATASLSGLHLERINGLSICRHITLIGFGGKIG